MQRGLLVRSVARFRSALTPGRDRGRGWILFAIALGWLITLGTRFLVPAILPQIKATFELDNAGAGVAITVIWACYALMQFPTGVLIDRVGERVLLTGSLLLAGASMLALGVSPSLPVFILACAAFGLGTGLYGPARGTAISKTFPDRSGAAFGLTLAAGSIGSASFPFLASLFVAALTWRITVGVIAVPFVATAVFAWTVVPVYASNDRRDGDEPAAMSFREAVLAVVDAIRTRAVVVAFLAMALMLFTFQGVTAFLPTYLIEQKGLSQGAASAVFALMFVGGAAFQIIAGNAADRFGERRVLIVTAAVGVLTVSLLPLVDGLVPLVGLVAVLGSRMAVAPVSNAYVIDVLPDRITGTTWGLLRTGFFLVASTGSTFVGTLADLGYFDSAFYVLGALTAVACALYFLLPRTAA